MEELGVGVSLFDVCHASTLLLSSPFHDGKRDDFPLQLGAEVNLFRKKLSMILHLVGE
jgi:hypothetical protein